MLKRVPLHSGGLATRNPGHTLLLQPHRARCLSSRSSDRVTSNRWSQLLSGSRSSTGLARRPVIPQAATADGTNSTSNDPDAGDEHGRSRGIRRLLASMSSAISDFVKWLQLPSVTWRQWVMRGGTFVVALLLLLAGRDLMAGHARSAPREVFYSDFVTLLDRGSVNAAWLESGEGRLHFNVVSGSVAAAKGTAAQAVAAAPSATAAASTSATAASRSGVAAAVSPSTASAPEVDLSGLSSAAVKAVSPTLLATDATSPPAPRQSLFIKLADKADLLLTQRILNAGVRFCIVQPSFQAALNKTLLQALAIWLPLMPIFFLFKRLLDSRGGLGGTSKKAKSLIQTPATTFADVAGVDGAKRELAEVVQLLRAEKAAMALAAKTGTSSSSAAAKASIVGVGKLRVKLPSGVLLCGPPGTGKTLLAKAVAGEAGVPFLSVSASEFVELFVGRGAARVRELFAEARQSAPSVIFIDELDAVGARRGMGFNDERDQTLNQLLTELDGFDARPGVLFLAATNRAEVLDPALLRPGRLARKVVVPLPDAAGRRDILGVHLRNIPLDAALAGPNMVSTCERLAQATPGFSGAELANVANEAVLMASRAEVEQVGMKELLQGVQRTKFGIDGRDGGTGDAGSGGGVGRGLRKWLLDVASSSTDGDANRRNVVKVMNG